MKRKLCPKCKSGNITTQEEALIYFEREYEDGVLIEGDEGDVSSPMLTGRINGWCHKCGHRWRFKTRSQKWEP